MGRKDMGHKEAKKPKKDARKMATAPIMPIEPAPEVEVIGKGKKRKPEEEE